MFILLGSSKGKQEIKKDISSPKPYNKTTDAQNQQEQENILMVRGSSKGNDEIRKDISSPQQPMNTPIQNAPYPYPMNP
jgi:hypothetical protein